jgi:hypothetical protein
MPARDALHLQVIMSEALAPGGMLGAMLDGFERSQRGLGKPNGEPSEVESLPNPVGMFRPDTPYDKGGDALRAYFARSIDLSLAFYVDPRMTELVTAAAESLPVDTVLRMHDLPHSHGFLLVPSGIAEVDIRGQLMVHNVVCWFQRAGGVDLWFLSNKYDERDMVNIRQRMEFGPDAFKMFPELMPAVYQRIEFGGGVPWGFGGSKVLPPEIAAQMRVVHDPKNKALAWTWPVGYDMDEWVAESGELQPSGPAVWMFALWMLMKQTIVDVRTEGADRKLRKAAAKRKMKATGVTVIHLRKRKSIQTEGPEQTIEYSHRWWVKGHWRMAWYGPRNGEIGVDRYQAPVYIHDFWKGPEGAPWLIRDKIYSLDR